MTGVTLVAWWSYCLYTRETVSLGELGRTRPGQMENPVVAVETLMMQTPLTLKLVVLFRALFWDKKLISHGYMRYLNN